jgi:hypothetical protein
MRLKERVQSWLLTSLGDPIVKIVAARSHLTKIQLETLLIDVLSESMAGKPLKYDEKARLRLMKSGISRGAFNRTLKQAKENVVRSIYTVLLLGYLGVFESTTLDPYIEISNKLKDYLKAYKEMAEETAGFREHREILEIMRKEIETSLEFLANP